MENATSLDLNVVKKMIQSFEKKLTKNRELRIKFDKKPEKFLDSECELFGELQSLHYLTCSSQFFKELVDLHLISYLLELLAHENNDISSVALELLFETIDPETVIDVRPLTAMTNHLINMNLYELTIDFITRLDTSDSESVNQLKMALCIVYSNVQLCWKL